MKKPLSIAILSYVAEQAPSSFPIKEFTIEGADGTTEECNRQIAELDQAGLLSAAIVKDRVGRPIGAFIRGITLEGRTYLSSWHDQNKASNPVRKASRWARDAVLLCIGFILGGLLTKFGEYLFEILKNQLSHP